ncbi:hypothetical protein M9Y10_024428 [Tritrichomonas musculus]|uniref:BTB domain-containing protein n=1 Tax=Tritrichomonas musculus TaxID=1915356 RepID=A0ABR2HC01_9EUKA
MEKYFISTMQDFNINIPSVDVQNDLTIIYKDGEGQLFEIKTSKDEFVRSLRYFQNQFNEINRTKLIYIQENIKFDIFDKFVSSTNTKQISLNESNYDIYYKLSHKYGYEELTKQIEDFISKRPDIVSIIDELSSITNKTDKEQSTDNLKEEIVAKNLDICIQNALLKKLPIEILNRILNSPKRIIKDHHLLFSFVIGFLKESNGKSLNDIEKENLLILQVALTTAK